MMMFGALSLLVQTEKEPLLIPVLIHVWWFPVILFLQDTEELCRTGSGQPGSSTFELETF